MSTPRPQITLMVHRDGEVGSRTFRMPIWLFRALVMLGTVLLMAALVVGALYAPLLKAAASVPLRIVKLRGAPAISTGSVSERCNGTSYPAGVGGRMAVLN